jgi:hypothetical protein
MHRSYAEAGIILLFLKNGFMHLPWKELQEGPLCATTHIEKRMVSHAWLAGGVAHKTIQKMEFGGF